MIDVKHLSKSFGEVEVLKDINETIDKGEKVVIVGPSGSGKSTFLRCLNLMEKPTSGDIFFEGENITQANEHEMNKLRQRMGMVFQHFNLFPHITIKKNIWNSYFWQMNRRVWSIVIWNGAICMFYTMRV